MSYIFSAELQVFMQLLIARMQRGGPAVVLLSGPPGGGKTSFAKEAARQLDAEMFTYAGAPDKERDLLYDYNLEGGISYARGPAWRAFDRTAEGPAVLLIDEVDKTSPNFDAFLLRLLEDFAFLGPKEADICADPGRLVVVLTSNGRRELRPELQRRCQRVTVPRPSRSCMLAIVDSLAPDVPPGLADLLVRLGQHVADKVGRSGEPEFAPSPVELARCGEDLVELTKLPGGEDLIAEVASSHLVKEGGPSLDEALRDEIRNWRKALRTEARK